MRAPSLSGWVWVVARCCLRCLFKTKKWGAKGERKEEREASAAGASWNPDRTAHQDLLGIAVAAEIERSDRAEFYALQAKVGLCDREYPRVPSVFGHHV